MYESEFPLDDSVIYLNHAAVSPWPERTATAVKHFADENVAFGSKNYPQWVQVESRLRKQLQQLVNADSSDEIALLKNTSEALSVVAYGLPWKPGDKVVIKLMSYPDKPLEGLVDSIGWGIAQQDGSTGADLLPNINPSFDWIRLAQRIPVRVHLTRMPEGVKLRLGTTATVIVLHEE